MNRSTGLALVVIAGLLAGCMQTGAPTYACDKNTTPGRGQGIIASAPPHQDAGGKFTCE